MVTLIATAVDNPEVKAEVTIGENYGVYWEIDPNGRITRRDTRQTHKTNRLYAIDKSGRETGKYIDVRDTDILDQLTTDRKNWVHSENLNGRYAVTNVLEVGGIFLFAADNTDVEWGLMGVNTQKGRYYVITTSHDKEKVELERANRLAGFDVFQIAFDIHSHPSATGTKGASGDAIGTNDENDGDMSLIIRRNNRFAEQGIPLPPHYVYHKHSRTLYEYTPWNSSIDKGTIRGNNGLNSIM
ncbi:MAG: hypothetical protein LBI15_10050 [Dysgonamonadaceae bacterium]|nr:hypothetical protein [Dysgonamonadaceae bacterium]